MIIALTGNIGCGKDTVSKMIQYYFACKNLGFKNSNPSIDIEVIGTLLDGEKNFKIFNIKGNKDCLINAEEESGWQIKKFAYKLKQIAAILVGCDAEDFESQEFKDRVLPEQFQLIGTGSFSDEKRTYMWLLQTLGTEAIRNNIHKDVWINALFADYKKAENDFPNWIISDLRFLNESKAIKDRKGIIIRIERDKIKETHISETELSKIQSDYTIYNYTTIENLYSMVCEMLKNFGF